MVFLFQNIPLHFIYIVVLHFHLTVVLELPLLTLSVGSTVVSVISGSGGGASGGDERFRLLRFFFGFSSSCSLKEFPR